MELPPNLRDAVDAALEGASTAALAEASAMLSQRYRSELRDGRFHVSEDDAARAYLAARLPATFAAVRAAMDAAESLMPEFRPKTLLDLGAGPGTAMWAARDTWPTIDNALMIEGSPTMRRWGETLAASAAPFQREWRAVDFAKAKLAVDAHDLVTIAYVLDELEEAARAALIEAAWQAAIGLLLIVEPGTPAGWQRILAARAQLIAAGAHILAPCAHEAPCPIVSPDWCHFSRRVARTKIHLRSKGAVVPFEDEKFIYLAASRTPREHTVARVLTPPKASSGKVSLKLCLPSGAAETRLITKREGALFKTARRLDWGDALDV
ncbi:methyltransferase type 11 [Kaistia sp. 32K]|uniref:small ribosomal subunit Rsm22 family protein n=1 Tax=Kaistia sp. 32K TaxID=2795690 RepID=UPI001915AC06|nr:small ribosomal subunit Rsm22 family protein [Kaistia sp. 32K]BCP54561.1 methyltransferase type 11 [Kaistia sp. 32K]